MNENNHAISSNLVQLNNNINSSITVITIIKSTTIEGQYSLRNAILRPYLSHHIIIIYLPEHRNQGTPRISADERKISGIL